MATKSSSYGADGKLKPDIDGCAKICWEYDNRGNQTKESYFDRKNWILENYDQLNLSNDETLFLLLVELAKKNNKPVTYEYLSKKLDLTNSEVDKMIADLVSKHYLKLSTNSRGLVFDIDAIFDFDPEKCKRDPDPQRRKKDRYVPDGL